MFISFDPFSVLLKLFTCFTANIFQTNLMENSIRHGCVLGWISEVYLGNSLIKMSTQLIYNFDKIFVNKWEMPGTHMMPLREELRSIGHQFSALNLDHDSGKAKPCECLGIHVCTLYVFNIKIDPKCMHWQTLGQTNIALRYHRSQMYFKVNFISRSQKRSEKLNSSVTWMAIASRHCSGERAPYLLLLWSSCEILYTVRATALPHNLTIFHFIFKRTISEKRRERESDGKTQTNKQTNRYIITSTWEAVYCSFIGASHTYTTMRSEHCTVVWICNG